MNVMIVIMGCLTVFMAVFTCVFSIRTIREVELWAQVCRRQSSTAKDTADVVDKLCDRLNGITARVDTLESEMTSVTYILERGHE